MERVTEITGKKLTFE
jgi:UDP-glucose 4-epimerase